MYLLTTSDKDTCLCTHSNLEDLLHAITEISSSKIVTNETSKKSPQNIICSARVHVPIKCAHIKLHSIYTHIRYHGIAARISTTASCFDHRKLVIVNTTLRATLDLPQALENTYAY